MVSINKVLFTITAMMVVCFGLEALAWEKKMSEGRCRAKIKSYAKSHGLKLKEWDKSDFYLLRKGRLVGNAYYSSGTCHIYRR